MRTTSVILPLVAFAIHMFAGRPAKIISDKKSGPATDTTIHDYQNAFLFASVSTKNMSEELIFNNDALKKILDEGKTTRFLLGQSKQLRNIEAWFFPGTSDQRALVIGGVHGTELSSIEVAETLIQQLKQEEKNYYNVIVIPCLFPDNAAMAGNNSENIGSASNIGR